MGSTGFHFLWLYDCRICGRSWGMSNSRGAPQLCWDCKLRVDPSKKVVVENYKHYEDDDESDYTGSDEYYDDESDYTGSDEYYDDDYYDDDESSYDDDYYDDDDYSDEEYGSSTGPLKRMFGKYYCKQCKRTWNSANSWEGWYQKCKMCLRKVYPCELAPIENPGPLAIINVKRRHQRTLCERCLESKPCSLA